MKALLDGEVLAEASADDVVSIEGNWYFPPASVTEGTLTASPTPYTCAWKGECQYYTVSVGERTVPDGAWAYPNLIPGAVERVGRDFAGFVTFGPNAEVVD
ncbi:MAG: DUF427 domain-containing protein [Propioniciclava sp.]